MTITKLNPMPSARRTAGSQQRVVGLPSVTPLVINGRCYHEWIKQSDGSYACWKCGEEKPAGSVEDRQPNIQS